MNLVLLLFNLLPAYPLDGGRILQGVLAIFYGFGRSVLIATRVGQVAAIVLGVLAIAYEQILVAVIALYIFLTCGQERQRVKRAPGAQASLSDSMRLPWINLRCWS